MQKCFVPQCPNYSGKGLCSKCWNASPGLVKMALCTSYATTEIAREVVRRAGVHIWNARLVARDEQLQSVTESTTLTREQYDLIASRVRP